MADRADRIAAIAAALADRDRPRRPATAPPCAVPASWPSSTWPRRWSIELSSLAGTMAREYALRAGETRRGRGSAVRDGTAPARPATRCRRALPGALLALADRFDLLAGLFAIGATPTGSSDPFGLRRAALGTINILRAHPDLAAITVEAGLAIAAEHQPVPSTAATTDDAVEFTARRFEQAMLESGHPIDHIRAVAPLAGAPGRAERTLRQLAELTSSRQFGELTAALQRARRIVPAGTPPHYDPALFESDAEHALDLALRETRRSIGDPTDLDRFTTEAAPLIEPINNFFDAVLVIADDPAVKANRLGLLAGVNELAAGVLAWSELG